MGGKIMIKSGDLFVTNRDLLCKLTDKIPAGSVGIVISRRKDYFLNYDIIYYVYIQNTVTTMSRSFFEILN